ncbi:hypothetical protein [Saliniramus sp.]|uniref:hypothetical protein n=1 Tax=Saliniramus sp. TaxID=2986772 RepID=UPI002BEB67E9|nr:hypothetical protein [Saliniramus sp.]HMB11208.1 hypothetical protein [Saliniramus sp.]
MQRRHAQEYRSLARYMVKQARMLKQMGLAAKAGALVERALAYHRLGWSLQGREPVLQPVPARVRSRR